MNWDLMTKVAMSELSTSMKDSQGRIKPPEQLKDALDKTLTKEQNG
jgi:hypothetical protein